MQPEPTISRSGNRPPERTPVRYPAPQSGTAARSDPPPCRPETRPATAPRAATTAPAQPAIVSAPGRMTLDQLERATVRAVEEGVRVYRLGDGRYAVPASSKPGYAYTVTVEEAYGDHCNCSASAHGRACKHLGAVLVLLAAERRMAELERRAEVCAKLVERGVPIMSALQHARDAHHI